MSCGASHLHLTRPADDERIIISGLFRDFPVVMMDLSRKTFPFSLSTGPSHHTERFRKRVYNAELKVKRSRRVDRCHRRELSSQNVFRK